MGEKFSILKKENNNKKKAVTLSCTADKNLGRKTKASFAHVKIPLGRPGTDFQDKVLQILQHVTE